MLNNQVKNRALAIKKSTSINRAVFGGMIPQHQDITLSEALILGLWNQGVRKYIGILGHGNTHMAAILYDYESAGLVNVYHVRNEVEAAHCATMLKWQYGETAAVITSIGPGALHAFAGSLTSASNGIGVYHIYGDETTHDEGPNMQQIPQNEQGSFLKLTQVMGNGYQLNTPEAIFSALRKGASTVFNPQFSGPFFFLVPMNTQPSVINKCNLLELPLKPVFPKVSTDDDNIFKTATELVDSAKCITIKYGGGAKKCGHEMMRLADTIDAVIVSGAKMSGVVPYSEKRFMSVGGTKGSICGNYAMNHADLVITLGSRAVCQWDCSGTAWKKAKNIINFNSNTEHLNHYNKSLLILGDAQSNLIKWNKYLEIRGFNKQSKVSEWLQTNLKNKKDWEDFKHKRYNNPTLFSDLHGRNILTQPAAIKIAYEFAKEKKAARYFDAGDVQANGFQIVEDEEYGLTYSDTGSSYMGFAASSLLANALAQHPIYAFAFSGDGSFTMNPQIIFDGQQYGLKGCLIIFDNRSMAAVEALQAVQYSGKYTSNVHVYTDYVAHVNAVKGVKGIFGGYSPDAFIDALDKAFNYQGLSVIHVPVYVGDHELGGMGVFGEWNVGNWCNKTQEEHHNIGL